MNLAKGRSGRGRNARRVLAVAAWAVLGVGAIGVQADTTATWLSETNGNWTNASLWSTSPNYPNNGTPAGQNYDAVINATGGSSYTLKLNSDVSLNNITINSADAIVDQT